MKLGVLVILSEDVRNEFKKLREMRLHQRCEMQLKNLILK